MGKFVDRTGLKYGKLTAIERVPNTSPIKWKCVCECGNEVVVQGNNLQTGNTTSCGCIDINNKLNKAKDISGMRFGRLVALQRAGYHVQPCGRRHILWECQCDCGNKTIVDISHLSTGETTSCGCYAKEFRKTAYTHNLTGKKFGRLTVVKQDKTREPGVFWICRCECGWFVSVAANSLAGGLTKSCGCLKMSRGEAVVNKVLKDLGVKYEREYSFDDLRTDSGRCMRFDFALFRDETLVGLIEFQGIQHFRSSTSDINFGRQQREETDALKREYCNQHKIPLIEIRYDEHTKYATLCAVTELYANPVPNRLCREV